MKKTRDGGGSGGADGAGGGGGGGGTWAERNNEPKGRSAATDDIVYERYKKRARR